MYNNPLHLVRVVGAVSNEEQLPATIQILLIRKINYRPVGIYMGVFIAGLGICECIYYFIDNSFKDWEIILYLYLSIIGAILFISWCFWYCCCPPRKPLETIVVV